MNDIIHLLPDSVANQIAAGEVIQRPASVIKELVENAVDAGATDVHVIVKDSGKTSIQVIDNGKGMSDTDARMSFERHATSKIDNAEDLFSLRTMGFRGEALASIAAVAQVELKTRTADEEVGTCIVIEGSEVKRQEPVACAVGANFMVKNLFYNVPARRKFLRSEHTELNNIITEFEHVALVNPDIHFSLYNNDNCLFDLPATTLKKRIVDVCGKKVNQWLLPIKVETSLINIGGFIAKPEFARKKALQYFFVNGRYMRHPYFNKAVAEAYDKFIPQGLQVPYFIYFDIDPANIDVNIHPTKTEIKFENEQYIWQIIISAIKESLGTFNAVPSLDFDTEGVPDIPAMGSVRNVSVPQVDIDKSYNPFAGNRENGLYRSNLRKAPADWMNLYEHESKSASEGEILDNWKNDMEQPSGMPDDYSGGGMMVHSAMNDDASSLFGEQDYGCETAHIRFKGKYLVTSLKTGILIIDQHRAHVKILYDKYLNRIGSGSGASQQVLFPHIIQLSPAEAVTMEKIMPELEAMGFDFSNLGNGNYAVNGVPADISDGEQSDLINDIIHATIAECEKNVKEDLRADIALSLAKASAIPYGRVLSDKEATELIMQLLCADIPEYTPEGKKIAYVIEDKDIDKFFR